MNTHLKHFAVLVIGISFLLSIYAEVDACTRVFWNTLSDLKIVARNEDYLTPVDPTMVISPRGITRVGSKEANAVRWTSKYGNVCIYANNRFPMDGINEKGLTARTLFFTQGKEVDAAHPDRPALDSDHWISYILDNFATVKEAVASIRNKVRLKVIHDHYEYASGKHIAMADEDKKLADMIKKEAAHPEKMLGTATYWQSISDLTNLHYRFKSAAAPSDVFVNLSEIDFSKKEGVRTIHMLDEHAQRDQFGNLIHDFVRIQGDIYDEQPD